MALDLLHDCTFTGPAFPEPFVRFEFEKELTKAGLLPKTSGSEGSKLQESWESYRRKLRELAAKGGPIRVRNLVIEPLVARLGYSSLAPAPDVQTREGKEAGGYLLTTTDNESKLRVWCTEAEEDLDAPAKRGAAYRYSHVRIAQRVLLACGERLGMITNGVELRLLISDPARPDSQIEIAIDTSWKRSRSVPDSYRLVLALASPKGQQVLPDLVDKARLQQARVTKELRVQSRKAIEGFIQEILDHLQNQPLLSEEPDTARLARSLWHEGLITVYRLLFILKLESSDDPARAFSFASSSLWRNSFSPTVALAPFVRNVLDEGVETGRVLEDGLRAIFRMFAEGLQCTELVVKPLGGSLFGEHATPLLSKLHWGERGVALLLDRLLWTIKKGSTARERVHYGPLDVEDLGRVYEALLELDPGIATESMARLRRQKLEVVVPIAQGEKYRPVKAVAVDELPDADEDDGDEDESETSSKKTKVEWIEQIPAGRFYLRVGLGRKSTGSYYTPHSFVRFLVQETLGPQVAERSPNDDPQPVEILKLKVLDPAMGSGHFLVEACRYLGEKLYEACRLCDERALAAEGRAETVKDDEERVAALAEAQNYRQRVLDLPDPDDELVKYLPSHAPEGLESGLSQRKAQALCRRLVAVHCLYGVDKNVLAVELAKLSLWIESHAEGLPLTFLDHRLVVGDSLTGPFFHHLLTYPGSKEPIEDLFSQGLRERFTQALGNALTHVRDLEATVGTTIAEVEAKQAAKARLDRALTPFKIVAAAWAGGVMLGQSECDDVAYVQLVREVSRTGDLSEGLEGKTRLLRMIARGLGVEAVGGDRNNIFMQLSVNQQGLALPYDLSFAEVFFPNGNVGQCHGFDAVLGNPPWDTIIPKSKEWLAAFDITILDAKSKPAQTAIEDAVLSIPGHRDLYQAYINSFGMQKRANNVLYQHQKVEIDGDLAGRFLDAFRVFMERNAQVLNGQGITGIVVPSAFHANEGATGVRKLYLSDFSIFHCYCFENRKQLFEIDSRQKFDIFTARRNELGTSDLECAFYLLEPQWLFDLQPSPQPFVYSRHFIESVDPDYCSFLELSYQPDLEIYETCAGQRSVKDWRKTWSISFSTSEMNMTKDAWRFINPKMPYPVGVASQRLDWCKHLKAFPLFEGKYVHQYNPFFGGGPKIAVSWNKINDREYWFNAVQHYRLAYRKIARATDERSAIWVLLTPLAVTAESCPSERSPLLRPNSQALAMLAVMNSYVADFLLGKRLAATVNLFLLDATPLPCWNTYASFLVHEALRLSTVDAQFEALWVEQVGNMWREPKESFTWPVLITNEERWQVRAAIDAVVANAYGLNREQYVHVLSTFSHKSYPKAPHLCLAMFDELQSIGLDAFTKKYDPYWDIPLNENLPKPVIDLPIPEASNGTGAQQSSLFADTDAR